MRGNFGSMSLVLILGLLLATANVALAQTAASDDPSTTGFIPERLDRIDDGINAEIAAGKIPGAVALVVKDGNVAYFKSFGFADIESQTPMRNNDHIFRIASMSKAITSVAIMILYEQGHFQLNDPVADYIPEFADMRVVSAVDDYGNVSATVVATKPIKIIDLLTHTSGISYPFISSSIQKSYVDAGIIDGVTARKITLASQMELLAKQPLLFESGSKLLMRSSRHWTCRTAIFICRKTKLIVLLPCTQMSRMLVWSYQRASNPVSFSTIRCIPLPVPGPIFQVVPDCPPLRLTMDVFCRCY